MEKPPEKFEAELAEIREELLRLGVRPTESPQRSPAIQKGLLEDWEQASHYWLNRMQLETAQSGTEAFDVYAKCVAQQMKMTVEDGQRLFNGFQYVTQKLTQSLRA